mmetsp:Transcript_61269/g.134704  ORF Transcript_61269/g.134704 Transcript_61269/m.134704 type:complete len:100 (+) Transcript_61269:39-338(+)
MVASKAGRGEGRTGRRQNADIAGHGPAPSRKNAMARDHLLQDASDKRWKRPHSFIEMNDMSFKFELEYEDVQQERSRTAGIDYDALLDEESLKLREVCA